MAVRVFCTPLYYFFMIKQKKSKLLCLVAIILLAVIGTVIILCVGCDTDDTPGGVQGDITTGDQITEETLPEEESMHSTENSETNEENMSEESHTPSEPSTPPSEESMSPVTGMPEEPKTDPQETMAETLPTNPEPLTFEEYHAMKAEDQEAYFLSYATPADFFAWYNAAKEKYLEENPGIEIGPDGSIPLP